MCRSPGGCIPENLTRGFSAHAAGKPCCRKTFELCRLSLCWVLLDSAQALSPHLVPAAPTPRPEPLSIQRAVLDGHPPRQSCGTQAGMGSEASWRMRSMMCLGSALGSRPASCLAATSSSALAAWRKAGGQKRWVWKDQRTPAATTGRKLQRWVRGKGWRAGLGSSTVYERGEHAAAPGAAFSNGNSYRKPVGRLRGMQKGRTYPSGPT